MASPIPLPNPNEKLLRDLVRLLNHRSRTFCFIDGAFFEYFCTDVVDKVYQSRKFEDYIDLSIFSCVYDRIYYFDALPVKKKGEDEKQFEARKTLKQDFLDRLGFIENFDVKKGESTREFKAGQKQKGVDLLLAIEALSHAYDNNMDNACFFLSDLDFFPLFEALNRTRVRTELFYEPRKTAMKLLSTVDKSQALTAGKVLEWQLESIPNKITLEVRKYGEISKKMQELYLEKKYKCGQNFINILKDGRRFYYGYFASNSSLNSVEVKISKSIHVILDSYEISPKIKVTEATQNEHP